MSSDLREINLSASFTAQVSIDLQNLPQKNANGKISFDSMNFSKSSEAIIMARKNGAHIVYGAIEVSQKMEGIIANRLFGNSAYPPEEKSFFKNNIMDSPNISFQFKKDLVKKIINESNLLEGKPKNVFSRGLDDISTWRNAFAHGSLVYDSKKGTLLNYYSGNQKTLELNGQYWNLVEETFKIVQSQLDILLAKK